VGSTRIVNPRRCAEKSLVIVPLMSNTSATHSNLCKSLPSYSAPSLTNMPSHGDNMVAEPFQSVQSAGTLMLLFSHPELVKPLQDGLAVHSPAN